MMLRDMNNPLKSFWIFSIGFLFLVSAALSCFANDRIVINGPPGSAAFGSKVYTLPNGNFVVIDPNFNPSPTAPGAGAVYLYDGATLSLISKLAGGFVNNHVGSGGIIILPSGNFVVLSPK